MPIPSHLQTTSSAQVIPLNSTPPAPPPTPQSAMPRLDSPDSSPPVHTASTVPRTTAPNHRSDALVLDLDLERRWATIRARLLLVQRSMMANRPIRTEPKYWVDVYTKMAILYNQEDEGRKKRMYVYVREYIRDVIATQLAYLRKCSGERLLREYCRTWKVTMEFVKFMKRVLHHLQRYWIRENANTLKEDPIRPLDKLALFYWREELLGKLHNIVNIAMDIIARDRLGETVNHALVKGVVDTLVKMGEADDIPCETDGTENVPKQEKSANLAIYVQAFEDEFLENTCAFYAIEGKKMAVVGNATKFMQGVMTRIEEEIGRGLRYLHPDSQPRLRQAIIEVLVGQHIPYLIEEAKKMFSEYIVDDLQMIYRLLSKVEGGLLPLRSFFVTFVRSDGAALIRDYFSTKRSNESITAHLNLVRMLISLHRKHAEMVKKCFNESNVMMLAIDDAFRGFANRSVGNVSLPTLIAHYIDELMSSGGTLDSDFWNPQKEMHRKVLSRPLTRSRNAAGGEKSAAVSTSSPRGRGRGSDATKRSIAIESRLMVEVATGITKQNSDMLSPISRHLSDLIRLFMYIDDKDLFFEIHRRLFAKRLMMMDMNNDQLESLFIMKMKEQMGAPYVQGLNGMLRDKKLSSSMRVGFAKYIADQKEQAMQISANLDKARASEKEPMDGNEESKNDHVNRIVIFTPGVGITYRKGKSASGSGRASRRYVKKEKVFKEAVKAMGEILHTPQDDVISKNTSRMEELEEAVGINFNAHVLNGRYWPASTAKDIQVPRVLKICQSLFTEYYMQDKERRKITWVHNLSSVHIWAHYGTKRYTLQMSAIQASILLLFNDTDKITVSDACKKLHMSQSDLMTAVEPLLRSRKSNLLLLEKESVAQHGEDNQMTTDKNRGSGSSKKGTSGQRGGSGSRTRRNSSNAGGATPRRRSLRSHASTQRQVAEGGTASGSNRGLGNGKRRRSEDTAPYETPSKRPRIERRVLRSTTREMERAAKALAEAKKAGDVPTDTEGQEGKEKVEETLCLDELHLNKSFTSKAVRIQISGCVDPVGSGEAVETQRNVIADRGTLVDATIVRLLKEKKEMMFGDMCSAVIAKTAGRFVCDTRFIKARLERLIEHEYVGRDEKRPELYKYC